jgi:hypothetical protein
MSSENWKKAVTEQRGDYSARLKLAHRIKGSGCSSWPTVSANEDSYRINGSTQASKCLSRMARRGELSWPTASSRDYKGAPQSRLTPEGYNARLDEAVIIYGPAAQVNLSTNGSRLESWATPRNMTGGTYQNGIQHSDLNSQAGGKLNPRWVETLMGLPVGWTMPSCACPVTIAPMNCGFSAMELFPPPQNEPSLP